MIAFLLLLPAGFSSAQTAADVQQKISQKNNDIAALEQEIASYQSELNAIGQQKSTLSGSLRQLDLSKKKLTADIAVTQNKIDETNLAIESLSSDIGTKENNISNNVGVITEEVKNTNELDQGSLVEGILAEKDFSSIWNDVDEMAALRERLIADITSLRQTKTALEDTRTSTIAAKNELIKLKTQLSDQQKIVVQNTNEKTKLLKQTQNNEANYQKLLSNSKAKKEALQKEVESFELQLQFILDPSKLPTGRILSWPLDNIFVTSPYGQRPGEFHRGVDFRAAVGTPVKAMADGVVIGTGNTDITCPRASFGEWVLLGHNNGLSSTYAHLSLIKVQTGERVARGEIIAYSGNTGYSTGPHLHISLYASKDSKGESGVQVETIPSKSCQGQTLTQPIAATTAYLNPLLYLPPYTLNSTINQVAE